MVYEYNGTNSAGGPAYYYGLTLISQGNNAYYLYNAHGDVVQLVSSTGTLGRSYEYDAFGNEVSPSAYDTNPFRYAGQYYDKDTRTYYLRARHYDPRIGRFTQQDNHWNIQNSIYGDEPYVCWSFSDVLNLNRYTLNPDILSIYQNINLYGYCCNNPISYVDKTGEALELALAGAGAVTMKTVVSAGATIGLTNIANPIGWAALIAVAVVGVSIGIYGVVRWAQDASTQKALDLINFASTAATPPPPDDPDGRGTKVESKTLYDKKGIRIDVENPGSRIGQIHIHRGSEKYIYDVGQKVFRTAGNELAPKTIQKLLESKDIIKAIAKGLTYLGY